MVLGSCTTVSGLYSTNFNGNFRSRGRADHTNIGKRPIDKVEPEVQDVPMKDTVKDDELEKINIDAKMDDEIDEIEKSPKLADLTITDEDVKTKRTPFFKQIFNGIRKKASVRAKERKIRQNRNLRKLILPKNALMALYEMKGIRISDFVLDTKGVGGFTALVTINGVEYEGVGPSKSAAKSDACEKALRDNIIKKMSQKPRLGSQSTDAGGENSEEVPANGGTQDDADDVPMINLASFAIYKLFTAWQNEGYTIPDFHNTPQTPNQSIDKPSPKATGRTELPPNWESMHPATLLCIMRPQLAYLDCGGSLDNGNPVQNVKVNVDGREFVGVGRSKKLARKNVATSICNTLFGTNFPIDN